MNTSLLHFHLSFLHPLGATDADKALLLKKWVDEVMVVKAKIKPACLIHDPVTGARMYGVYRCLQGWNVNKFEAHVSRHGAGYNCPVAHNQYINSHCGYW